MKKIIILFGIILCSNKLLAPVVDEVRLFVFAPIQPYEKLWEAVCFVESSFNPFAVNESEQAYGISQIRQVKLDWYFKCTGIRYTLADCFDVSVAKEIFTFHMDCYSDLDLAVKRWNGSGKKAESYFTKVQNYLNEKV